MKTFIKHSFSILTIIILSAFTSQAQIQKGLDMNGESADDESGYSVSMPDINTVAIGAYGNDGWGINSGHVRIYSWDGTAWQQKGIDIDGEAAGDKSGWSVSMPDSNTVAIGATDNDGNGINSGHVRIYSWNGSTWMQRGLDIEGDSADDRSGWSVSMPDSNTVGIGSIYNDGNGDNAGQVRVYSWNGIAWVQKGNNIYGEAIGDIFGYSISMPDSNTIAVGAPNNEGNGNLSGHVRIYKWDGTTWLQKGIDIDGEAAQDRSGWSVSMPDSNTIANGPKVGHVRIYTWNGSAWVQKGIDIDKGYSVSMPDINTVSIGDPGGGYWINSGHVRIYTWDGTAWLQKGIDIDGEAAQDRSGWSVSMSDAYTVAIGAPFNDDNGLNTGHVRIYTSFCSELDTTVTNISPILTANATPATYQWLDCNNMMAPLSSATYQTFTATVNGSYAVEVTQYGCVDTSACQLVNNISIQQNDFGNSLSIYPNPTKGKLHIELEENYTTLYITVRNELGQEVLTQESNAQHSIEINIPGSAGIYFVEVNANNKTAILKIIKE